ncbi:putative pectinesterase/pectinesterase inhibitor 28 [Phoenix dactylifera]|uniref:Pectinesterase n=1 Tax=Phoenix dactylifera TaxID=42345 RepID=A0A8B7CBT6_PHODC|nr:putative pectinesterase/pectinesterase inhibitor 28 [Phoenix dactylifera]XP_038974297.1 putative pectinesterase/pectinesterase inhibitor 28 [Phoenix dactylifera]
MEKNRVALISLSLVLLVAVVAAVAVTVSHLNSSTSTYRPSETGQPNTSIKAIKAVCEPTDYKDACEKTLSSMSHNTSDPMELVNVAFNASMKYVTDAFDKSELLKDVSKDPASAEALRTCSELLEYATDDLKKSIEQLGSVQTNRYEQAVEDLKVWLSAAITYQDTCVDGFEGINTSAAEAMHQAIKNSTQITSNALAMINQFDNLVGSFNISSHAGRKLLSGTRANEFPWWMSAAQERFLQPAPAQIKPNVTVAQDGTGDFKTISEALKHVPKQNNDTFVIYVKAGVYKEGVLVDKHMTHVTMIGDGPTKTKITGDVHVIQGKISTFKTATVAVAGEWFTGMGLGFENTAGPQNHQAVALRVNADRSVFYNCRMDGYQDTLYAHSGRQFYRDCTITGTIDFIFGDSATMLQNCMIIVRKPMDNQQNIVTAHGRIDRQGNGALVIQNCTITSDPAYYPSRKKLPTYLGRPWKPYSRTLILQSQLDDLVHPDGWMPWNGNIGLDTCFYAELDNRGPGANLTKRVTWPGIKKLSYDEAQRFTVEHYLFGQTWIPRTGVPFIPGLLPMAEANRTH